MTPPVRGLMGGEHLAVDIAACCLHVSEPKARAWLEPRGLIRHTREGREYVVWHEVLDAMRLHQPVVTWPRRPTKGTGWVYFVQAEPGTPVKIGYAANPTERLSGIQTGNPYRLRILLAVPGSREHEKMLHGHFYASRAIGEWFAETDELRAMIEDWGKRGRVWEAPAVDDEADIDALLADALAPSPTAQR